ncbi:MAG: hypothetical protein ACT4PV_06375 [Planctomycetaceae bacterium]
MSVAALLRGQERARARGVARRTARRVFLLGAAAVAAALFLERSGFDPPWLALPFPGGAGVPGLRVFAWIAISLAGLLQGALLLAWILAAALVVRTVGPRLLRRAPRRTAEDLDRLLATDRFSAAREAKGPLAPIVVACALRHPPSPALLAGRRGGRILPALALLCVLLVALMPGTAPGGEGPAPVEGAERPGEEEAPLLLRLHGPRRLFHAAEPVPLEVVLEASGRVREEIAFPVLLRIDAGAPVEVDGSLALSPGGASRSAMGLDLRRFARELGAGEHVAVALAGPLESNEYRFRIEPPASPPQPPPPPPNPPPPPPGEEGTTGGVPLRPEYVEPLLRDGEQVPKEARVPVEVPGGGTPAERPLSEAWPELKKRLEAALDRPGLSPAARALVREYFERLRPK